MRFGILGPLTVWTSGGRPVSVPGLKVRGLLSDLLVHAGRPVPADRLVDDLWSDDELPGNPPAALSVKVSQLRRILEDAEPGGRDLVANTPAGYVLRGECDAASFESLLAEAAAAEEPRARAKHLAEALALWRGPAFADFADHDFTRAAAARLHELRLTAREDQAEVRLTLGEHAALAAELGDLLTEHPLRERLRAAHMRALYRSGRQSEALASYETHREVLAEELGLDPGPDLAALQRAVLVQDPALAAPAASATAGPARPKGNVPAPLGALIGREEAVAEILARAGEERLVTLTGPGGVGKTRLAVEVAGRMSAPDGVWLVELAAVDRPGDADAVARLAEAIGVVLSLQGAGDPVERLAETLRSRQAVLVLDNCEHVIDPIAELAGRLLSRSPGLRLLATSQEPLGLAGELVWSVPPLRVPGPGEAAGRVRQAAAVRLFVERAAAADRRFTLDDEDAAAAAVLCRRLDGIPLALELAATRVRALGVSGVVERLDDRFRLLATGHRGAPPRQQTLMAMIDWSWELLGEEERAVLRRLAVHADGCSMEAAEEVGGSGGLDVLDLLARLIDRSLVSAHEGRYRLLESVAAYCVERLREAGELEEMQARHHRYYTGLAVRAEPYLRGGEQRRWLRRLDADAANLRAALGHAVRNGAAGDALALAGALGWYWFLRGRLSEGVRSLTAALALPGGEPRQRAVALAWKTGLEFLHRPEASGEAAAGRAALRAAALDAFGADGPEKARAQWFLAYTSVDLGDMAAAEELAAAALPVFEAHGDAWGTAAVRALRAKLAHVRGDVAGIERDAEISRAAFTRLGDRWGLMEANGWLGGAAEFRGEAREAERLQREGLRMAEELELWVEVAGRMGWVGWLAHQRGDYDEAVAMCERGLELAKLQGHHPSQVLAAMSLAFAARRRGELERADALLREIRALASPEDEVAEPPPYLPLVLAEQAFVAEGLGEARRALRLSLAALDASEALRDELGFPLGQLALATALAACGRPEQAAGLVAIHDELREGTPVSAAEQRDHDRLAERLLAELGEERYKAARAADQTREDLINAARTMPQ
ncbi:BTAD domain-containing putative transcriptional regulator [Nonomuraea sp. NPDC050540]|uniref:BTAD domain-containing putative transcriptional regulator n=1 Tax=Nonomuraea sp. NPDC050540 TaxID=3364367 RepID=UPI0037A70594